MFDLGRIERSKAGRHSYHKVGKVRPSETNSEFIFLAMVPVYEDITMPLISIRILPIVILISNNGKENSGKENSEDEIV